MVFYSLSLVILCLYTADAFNISGNNTTPACNKLTTQATCEQTSCSDQTCTCIEQSSCKQICEKCDNSSLYCQSDLHCDQTISVRGNATTLAAKATSITQRCSQNSNCEELKCSGINGNGTCLQVCDDGSNCQTMDCADTTSCSLYCDGNSICHSMTCHQNVSDCHLECVAGAQCNMTCFSRECSFVCHVGSVCHYTRRNVTFPGPPGKPRNATSTAGLQLSHSIERIIPLSSFIAMSIISFY